MADNLLFIKEEIDEEKLNIIVPVLADHDDDDDEPSR